MMTTFVDAQLSLCPCVKLLCRVLVIHTFCITEQYRTGVVLQVVHQRRRVRVPRTVALSEVRHHLQCQQPGEPFRVRLPFLLTLQQQEATTLM
jgi:hypothetical protein